MPRAGLKSRQDFYFPRFFPNFSLLKIQADKALFLPVLPEGLQYFTSYFQVITFPLVAAVIKIVYWGGDYFFVYLWAFVVGFTLFMMIIYPEFIAPLFDKYTPLPEGELRTQIEELAASIEFPLYKLFVVEGSKR